MREHIEEVALLSVDDLLHFGQLIAAEIIDSPPLIDERFRLGRSAELTAIPATAPESAVETLARVDMRRPARIAVDLLYAEPSQPGALFAGDELAPAVAEYVSRHAAHP